MIIVGDIGNTEIKIFLSFKNQYKKILLDTKNINYSVLRKKLNFLKKHKYEKNILFCSVVPKVYNKLNKFFFKEFKIKCIEIKKLNLNKIININVNRKEIGSDRISNAIGVMNKKDNFIVVDFGTATTFDVITKNNYLGGVIAPGVTLSLDNLIKRASLGTSASFLQN